METRHRLFWNPSAGKHERHACYEVEVDQLGLDAPCNCTGMVYTKPEKLLTVAEASKLLAAMPGLMEMAARLAPKETREDNDNGS